MKATLVIDMPKNCGDCPCAGEEFGICQADEKHRDCDWYKIPSWCPLKTLPEEKWENVPDHDERIYANGFNDCLHIITDEGWTCKLGG